MKEILLSIIVLFALSFSSFPQNTEIEVSDSLQKELARRDSIILDSLLNHNDTILLNNGDSIFIDSLKTNLTEDTTQVFYIDTIASKDTVLKQTDYDIIMKRFQDSLIFEEPDSIHFILYNLNHKLKSAQIINDSLIQAFNRLSHYITSKDIEPTIQYLQSQFSEDLSDSTLQTASDSILYSLKYLIESIPEDSVHLFFTNIENDTILLDAKVRERDSIRINLFDNRSEYAVLWIKKSNDNIYTISLEDGIYLEKARQKRVVTQKLDSDFMFPNLRKMKKVNKTIPIWLFDGSADVRFNQGYISDTWSEGGESSISALSILKYSADYNYGKLRNFDTDFEYRLGYIKAGDNDLKKNDDKFEVNAKYGRSAFNNWYYSALLNFKTQIFEGKEYVNDTTVNVISEFFSPAYVIFSLGLDYKPSSKLTVMISPITSKFTIVADTINYDQTRFGVGQDEYIRKEIGAYVKAISKIKFRENIFLENKINFFTNYTNNPQNIDVDWEVNLKIKLTDYINMSVNAHFIYDDDVTFIDKDGNERGARAQFKELLGVGFSYMF